MKNKIPISIRKVKESALVLLMSEDIEYELKKLTSKYVTSSGVNMLDIISEVLKSCMDYYDYLLTRNIKGDIEFFKDGSWKKREKPDAFALLSAKATEDYYKILDEEVDINNEVIEDYRNNRELPISLFMSSKNIYPKNIGGKITWRKINKVYEKVKIFISNSNTNTGNLNIKETEPIEDKNFNTNSNFSETNKFNKMPLEKVRKYFGQLSIVNNKNGNPFLEQSDVDAFIDKAFIGNNSSKLLHINFGDGEQLYVWKLFYNYYATCTNPETSVERTKQCRDKYIKLLTDNFDNFKFKDVKSNFRKSWDVKRDWDPIK